MGFSGVANSKESSCQCRRCKTCRFDPWVEKIPLRRKWQTSPVFFPGESQGQRSLAAYSPWGCEESDMTVCAHTHTHTHTRSYSKIWENIHHHVKDVIMEGNFKFLLLLFFILVHLHFLSFFFLFLSFFFLQQARITLVKHLKKKNFVK